SAKDKGKKKVTETEVPKKKKLHEQIDAQVVREMEEEFARENQRLSEQAVRDYEIARIHAEEELKLMIECLNKSNEVIAKHLSEYKQAEADLSVCEKIELISELVKYQDYLVEIHKLVHSSINSCHLCCTLPSSASREGTLGDDSWDMVEVLAMFFLPCPTSKLGTVGKASPCLSSLERDAGSSTSEVENHVEVNNQIEVIGVSELRVYDGA
nr:hypothetical protein [Tanacetum cinerariifolium]